MLAPENKKIKSLTKFLVVLALFNLIIFTAGPVLLYPQPASAQWSVTDAGLLGQQTAKQVLDKLKDILKQILEQLVAVLFKNVLGYLGQELARYAAEYIVSGDKAQKPAFFSNPGQFFSNMASSVSSEFVNSFVKGMTDDTIDLCKPMDPTVQFGISLNLLPPEAKNKYQEWDSANKCSWQNIQKNVQGTWQNGAKKELVKFNLDITAGPTAKYEEGLENSFVNLLNQDPNMNVYLVGKVREAVLANVSELKSVQQEYKNIMDNVDQVLSRGGETGEGEATPAVFPGEENVLEQVDAEGQAIMEDAEQSMGWLADRLSAIKVSDSRLQLDEMKRYAEQCLDEKLNKGAANFCARKNQDGITCWSLFLNIPDEGTCVNQLLGEPNGTLEKSITETKKFAIQIADWQNRLENMILNSRAHLAEGVENSGPNFVSLADVQKLFDSKGNDLTVAMAAKSEMFSKQVETTQTQSFFRQIQGGMNAVTSTISGVVKSPAEIVRSQTESAFAKAGAKELQFTGQLVADIVSTFTNTLMSKLMEKITTSLNPQADTAPKLTMPTIPMRVPAGYKAPQAASAAPAPGKKEAKETLASILVSSPKSVSGSLNLLTDFAICPDQFAGQNNCVIDEGFLMAVSRRLTVAEALKEGILHGDWPLIPPTDTEKNQDSKCFTYAYCYSNLVKLRRARIMPVGWEIAATKSNSTVTLQQAIDAFNDPGPDKTPYTADDPFYHLIDPNWVIKNSLSQCRAVAYGELLQSKDSNVRQEVCVDTPSCINEKSDENCGGTWGYCTREKNVWRFSRSTECPKYFNTCQDFTRLSDNETTHYLKNTLDFEDCGSDTAKGCKWYCDDWNEKWSRWECYWNDKEVKYDGLYTENADAGDRTFFNKNVSQCAEEDWGCQEFIRLSQPERGKTEEIFSNVQGKADESDDYGNYTPVEKTYLKKAPDYLNCYDEDLANNSNKCADFAASCTQDEVGCEKYSPLSGGPAVPGLISEYDSCPAECAGYKHYKEMATNFDTGRDPVALIPSTGQSCPAAEAGCEEFTNLDVVAAGGEGLEYYSYIRQCQKPAPDCSPFYTWTGSDTTGYQLKVYNLKTDPAAPNRPAEVVNPSSGQCAGPGDALVNPECKEFYAPDGTVSYHLYKNTITCSTDCHPLRKTTPVAKESCESTGGIWEGTEGEAAAACLYMSIPSEGLSCSASSFGCREYRGNSAYNISVILENNFEDGTNMDWAAGTNSNESTEPFQHSLSVSQAAVKNMAVVGGKSYLLNFWAKDGAAISAGLQGEGLNLQFGGITSSSEWRFYALGPLYVAKSGNFNLQFTGTGTFYLDNVKVSEILDRAFLIKDSWQTPSSCDNPLKEFYLNCDAYQDRQSKIHYLKSFTKICREGAVGCGALINTQNSASPYGQTFNADTCVLDGACESIGGCACQKNSQTVCQVPVGKKSCSYNISESTIVVPNDEINYLVIDSAFSCQEGNKGCSKFGLPSIDQEGMIGDYKDAYLMDNPDVYSSSEVSPTAKPILCKSEEVGCEEYGLGGGGSVVFKDPKTRVCEYRENVNIGGELMTGWFKSGKDEPCYDDFEIRQAAESAYNDWAAVCPSEMSGCTLFVDPQGGASENLVNNGGFEEPEMTEPKIYTNPNEAFPEQWSKNRNADVGEYSFGFKGTDYYSGGFINGYSVSSALKAVYTDFDNSIKQIINLKPHTFYKLAAYVKDGGDTAPAQVTLTDCVSVLGQTLEGKSAADFMAEVRSELTPEEMFGLTEADILKLAEEKFNGLFGNITSPNGSMILDEKEIHTQATLSIAKDRLSGTEYRYFDGQFYSGSSVECTMAFGADGNSSNNHGHWFDNLEIKEVGQYYYLHDNLDSKSCKGLVSEREGCILFNDTSNASLNYNSIATYTKSRLSQPAEKAVDPINCQNNSTIKECQQVSQTSNDANIILKVDRDRVCAQWLTCRSSVAGFNPSTNKYEEICEQLGLCDEIKGTGEKTQCGHWVEPKAEKLTEMAYKKRDVRWSGFEYSGYSIPARYPVNLLGALNFGTPENPDYRLTYAKPATGFAEICPVGTQNLHGMCAYGAIESETTVKESSITKTCRGYPEENSPFPSNASGDYLAKANKCEEGENCECTYQKINFGIGETQIKYYSVNKPLTGAGGVPAGVCQGGRDKINNRSLDGTPCNPETEGSTAAPGTTDVCQRKTGGVCNALQKQASAYGWEGYCLEEDESRTIYSDGEGRIKHPCYTWLPLRQLTGAQDLFNQFKEAGFKMPTNKSTLDYCSIAQVWGYQIPREKREDYDFKTRYISRENNGDKCRSVGTACCNAWKDADGDWHCEGDKIDECTETYYENDCGGDYDESDWDSDCESHCEGYGCLDGSCGSGSNDACIKISEKTCDVDGGDGYYLYNGLVGPEKKSGQQWAAGSASSFNSVINTDWNGDTYSSYDETYAEAETDKKFGSTNLSLDENRCLQVIELSNPVANTNKTWSGFSGTINGVSFSVGCNDNFGEMTDLTNPMTQSVVFGGSSANCSLISNYYNPHGFTYSYGGNMLTVPPSSRTVAISQSSSISLAGLQQIFVKADYSTFNCNIDPVSGRAICSPTPACWDFRQVQGQNNGPRVTAVNLSDCDQAGHCAESASNAITANDKLGTEKDKEGNYAGDIVGEGGAKDVTLKFFAWATPDHMPIRRISINWGDGVATGGTDGYYKNHRGYHYRNGDPAIQPRIICDTAEEGFGGSAPACVGSHFVFSHNYICNGPKTVGNRMCTGAAADPNASFDQDGCWDKDANRGFGACVFKPRVSIQDNWGWCTNNVYAGAATCGAADGECSALPASWVSFKGRIVVHP